VKLKPYCISIHMCAVTLPFYHFPLKYGHLASLIHACLDPSFPCCKEGKGVLIRGDDDDRAGIATDIDTADAEVEPVAHGDVDIELILDLVPGTPRCLSP
jgi:hypothetical protein